jgi:hypothetical protein
MFAVWAIDKKSADRALSFSFPLSACHAAPKASALRGRCAIIKIILIKVGPGDGRWRQI